ncbi:MAG: LexA family transcriptional regulator [Deltaproteobacteria bacterium]|nr:LexA family transcriptional regulator [Deltaproteobacteria bacterium]
MTSKFNLSEIKDVFLSFQHDQGRMPSYSEICKLFGYKSKNAAFRLVEKLIDIGVVSKSSGGKIIPGALGRPLRLLGSIQAGFPTPAEEAILDTISLDEYLIRNPQSSFLLRVFGDSMIDEGIRPDDLVIVERGRSPKNGDIVLAQIDDAWTLKFYENRGGQVRLVPGNRNYPVLVPQHELKVAGVVSSVVRRYF